MTEYLRVLISKRIASLESEIQGLDPSVKQEAGKMTWNDLISHLEQRPKLHGELRRALVTLDLQGGNIRPLLQDLANKMLKGQTTEVQHI